MKSIDFDKEPIVAQCTPQGRGALCIIRVSGENAITIVDSVSKLSSKKTLESQKANTIHHGFVVDQHQDKVDEVMFSIFKAPRSFTGQDTIEITNHNNQLITNKIMSLLLQNGCRLAQEGEFSKRAFLNNKIDLIQAEAIHDLITAKNQTSLKLALSQVVGQLSNKINSIQENIFYLSALLESSFEFSEEEHMNLDFNQMVEEHVKNLILEVEAIKKGSEKYNQIVDGIKIAIVGPTNAGKSTLFNAIVGSDRAIVSNIHGTTRDVVDSTVAFENQIWSLIDTAGIRKTDNEIEFAGIKKSKEQIKIADIIVFMLDGSEKNINSEYLKLINQLIKEQKNLILVVNKNDLFQKTQITKNLENQFNLKPLNISAKNNFNIEELKKIINEKIKNIFKQNNSPFLINNRQRLLLNQIHTDLCQIKQMIQDNFEYEVVSIHVRKILESLTSMTGKTIDEQTMNKVFSSFCIGK